MRNNRLTALINGQTQANGHPRTNGDKPTLLWEDKTSVSKAAPRLAGEVNPRANRLKVVVFGLSITSSWGNGHATTYRSLLRELAARGHDILFLEREQEWYASNRDLPKPRYCRLGLYHQASEAIDRFGEDVRGADLVIVGSYVAEGAMLGRWVTRHARGVTVFYDIDTPVTLARLAKGDLDYLTTALIPHYNLYLSFTGGPTLERLETQFGAQMARPLYCSVDPSLYYPEEKKMRWDMGYMGTYSDDRQPALDELLLQVARAWESARFVVAGPQYPPGLRWPKNVKRFTHLAPSKHRAFYSSQRFTLNVTRGDMIEAGYSPSVRLFEAAACGTPVISDLWEGLETFFTPGKDILVAQSSEESLYYLLEIPEWERRQIGQRARARVLGAHTARHRALELETLALDILQPTRTRALPENTRAMAPAV